MHPNIDIQTSMPRSPIKTKTTQEPAKRKRGRPLTRVFMDLFEFHATAFDARKYVALPLEEALEKYARFIKKIAIDYLPYARGLEFEDLVSAGKIGVIEAIKKYDPLKIRRKKKGGKRKRLYLCSFSTYVQNSIYWHIKNEIDSFVEGTKVKHGKQGKVKKVIPEYVALDAAISSEDDASFHELIADENAVSPSQSALFAEMWGIVERLPAAQQSVLKMRYKEGKTLEQAGDVLGLTRERVRQIEDKAIGKLRELML